MLTERWLIGFDDLECSLTNSPPYPTLDTLLIFMLHVLLVEFLT